MWFKEAGSRLRYNNSRRWLWVPAFAGTTVRVAANSTRRANHSSDFQNLSSPGSKNISLHNSVNQNYNSARLAPARGAYHDRHDTLDAGCDGRFGVRRFLTPDENAKAYGEVVWSWRRDAGAKLVGSVPPATVTTSPLHRGERDISRKAIVQGMSDCLRS